MLGFNDQGAIEERLPGTFLSIDGAEYASIADLSQTYNVEVRGIREGKFTLGVDIVKEGGATSFYYPEVPVKEGTIAQVKIKPQKSTTSFPDLQVNTEGKTSKIPAHVPPPEATTLRAIPATTSGSGPLTGLAETGPLAYVGIITSWASEVPWLPAGVTVLMLIVLVQAVLPDRRRRRAKPAASRGQRKPGKEQVQADVMPSVPSTVRGQQGVGRGETICPQCGAQAEPTAKFCGDCGTKLGGGYCPQCNSRIEPGQRFCSDCGRALSGDLVEAGTAGPEERLNGDLEQRRGKRQLHCPACGLEWGTGIACQHCRQVADFPGGVRISSAWKRLGAYLMDAFLATLTLGVGYFIWLLIVLRNGQTPGKQVLKMRAVHLDSGASASWGRGFLRDLVVRPLLASLTLGLAVLWLIWDPKKQALWDKVVRTVVVDDPQKQVPRGKSSTLHVVLGLAAVLLVLYLVAGALVNPT